jgi:hypothetical protein
MSRDEAWISVDDLREQLTAEVICTSMEDA